MALPDDTPPGAPSAAAEAPPARVSVVAAPTRATMGERLTLAILSLGAIALLVLASLIAPDPSGVGTHQKLGLPPCGLYEVTGVPCPSCGMTTSFAHAVRLEPFAALRAQPLGFLLACGALVTALLGPALALRGARVFGRLPEGIAARSGWWLLGAIVVAWAYKLAAVKGWIRL